MYLLDTNVVSEIRRIGSGKADKGVAMWAASVAVQDMFLSVVTIMELRRGVLSLAGRDPQQAARIRAWLERDIMQSFRGRILGVNLDTSIICAQLHVPNLRPDNDAWIAATAIEHELTIVTRNVRDFSGTGAQLFNPFG